MKKIVIGASIASLMLFSGCASRLGNLTVASTNNIDGLHVNVTKKDRTVGESCNRAFLFIPWGDFQNRLQIAIDNAIDNGHKKGIRGDALVNAKINVKSFSLLIYGQNCLEVEGDLVPLAKNIK